MFEQLEKGSADKLKKFLKEGAYKYEVGVKDLVYKPSLSFTELMDPRLFFASFKLHVFKPFDKYVRSYFKHPQLVSLMEFPVLFLGAMPQDTPALYSLMNYAALSMGTWYPMGGMHKIVEAMKHVAEEQGVNFHTNSEVEKIIVENGKASALQISDEAHHADVLLATADYRHVDQKLLASPHRHYSEKYWDGQVLAPSSLIFYLGVNKKVPKLQHHTLFFDNNLDLHAQEIYKNKKWPTKPLFYVCLLYTSPSPRDATLSRMPSSA